MTEQNDNVNSGTPTTNRRKRRSPEELYQEALAKAEMYKAKMEGTYQPENDSYGVKRIRAALRKRKTALHAAQVTIDGRASTDKSPALNGIDAKIENAERRLEQLRETRERAMEQIAALPSDIETLSELVERIEDGEAEPEFPKGLHRLPGEGEQTEAEAEVASVLDND